LSVIEGVGSLFNINFRDIDWGPDEAKGDKNLSKYFVEIPEYNDILSGRFRYVIGRKGAGKTAILERVKLEAENDPLSFARSLSLRDFPLQILKSLRDKTMEDKSQYVPVWKFLILTELSKMIISDNGIEDLDAVKDLKTFINNNFPGETSFIETLQVLNKNLGKINILSKFLGGEFSHEVSSQQTSSVYYQKAVVFLENKINEINSDSIYYIFVDELDEGYKAGDSGKRLLLLSLIRAIEDTYLIINRNGNIKYRPILALRSDIFDNLLDNDLNKLDDYIIRVKWTSGNVGGYYPLKDIATKRIRAYITEAYGQQIGDQCQGDLWGLVVDDTCQIKGAPLWNYICNNTFERPRDIIKYMKLCQPLSGKLESEDVKNAEYSFSSWFYNEFRDEAHSYFPIWKESLSCITKLGTGRTTTDKLANVLKSDPQIIKWMDNNNKDVYDIIEELFNYSVVGNLDTTKRWLFKYKDDTLVFDKDKEIIVHFGFKRKLRLDIGKRDLSGVIARSPAKSN
jgi:hypothetical protein